MTVAELIEKLRDMPQDARVIMQNDAEGNGFSPLAGADSNAIYREQTNWSGDVLSTEWSAEDACFEAKEWEEFKSSNPRCCVLYPIN